MTTREHFYRRIGNLVLMMADQNSQIGNASFAEKKPILRQSGLSLTKMVGNEKEWTQGKIIARQKKLAAHAVKTWPLKIA